MRGTDTSRKLGVCLRIQGFWEALNLLLSISNQCDIKETQIEAILGDVLKTLLSYARLNPWSYFCDDAAPRSGGFCTFLAPHTGVA